MEKLTLANEDLEKEIEIDEIIRPSLVGLITDNKYTDVDLIVEGEKFAAHRIILTAQSKYFEALLFGKFIEGQNGSAVLNDVKLKPFKVIWHYLYSGQLKVNTKDAYDVVDVLDLAHYLQLEAVIKALNKYMINVEPDTGNVIAFFNCAFTYNDESLKTFFLNAINNRAIDILKHHAFNTFLEDALIKLLESDHFAAPEIDIFHAVDGWIQTNSSIKPENILSKIRLTMVSTKDLIKAVLPKEHFSKDKIFEAILKKEDYSLLDICRYHPLITLTGSFSIETPLKTDKTLTNSQPRTGGIRNVTSTGTGNQRPAFGFCMKPEPPLFGGGSQSHLLGMSVPPPIFGASPQPQRQQQINFGTNSQAQRQQQITFGSVGNDPLVESDNDSTGSEDMIHCLSNKGSIFVLSKFNWVGRIEVEVSEKCHLNVDVALDEGLCFDNVVSKWHHGELVCNFVPRFTKYVRFRSLSNQGSISNIRIYSFAPDVQRNQLLGNINIPLND